MAPSKRTASSFASEPCHTSIAELDSCADTSTFGYGAAIVQETGDTVSVTPFDKTLGALDNIPIVTAAVAYDCPTTLHTYILFFHQSLYVPSMDHHLICPNQMRQNHITINDVPLRYLPHHERTSQQHSIITNSVDPPLHIPLQMTGPKSCFTVRKPTPTELTDDQHCLHVHLTSDGKWEPADDAFATNEESIRFELDRMSGERGQTIQSLSTLRQMLRPSPPSILSLSSTSTKPKRKGFVSPEDLAKRWGLGLEEAKKTVEVTTQLAVRDFTHTTGGRRIKPYAYQLKYPRLKVEMYCDTLYGKVKSLLGNKVAMVYCTPFHWTRVDPMAKRAESHSTLDSLFRNVGVPKAMISDNAREFVTGKFEEKLKRVQCASKPVEAYTPNQNRAEDAIRELKRAYRRCMMNTNSPEVLWDLCMVYHAQIRSHSALNIHELQGDTPQAVLTGDAPDISHLAEFGWYDYVWYITPDKESIQTRHLGRYCGPSHDVGEALCARVLTAKGKLISRTSVFPLKREDQENESVQARKLNYEQSLKTVLKDGYETKQEDDENPEDPDDQGDVTPTHELYDPSTDGDPKDSQLVEADDLSHEYYDRYVSARVCLPQGDQASYGKVLSRKRDSEGNLLGNSNANPLLDTSSYQVQFDTGEIEEFTANVIAESIQAQIDDDGYNLHELSEILDHRTDDTATKLEDAFFITKSGRKCPKKTTKGWQLCIRFKDGSTSWHSLKDIKDANPIELAQYAVNSGIAKEPAFSWWVPFVIKKSNRIIKALKKKYYRTFQKYGVAIPKTVLEALAIDEATGTTFWKDAIEKEMKTVGKAFRILDEGALPPPGYTDIKCHMIFDVKQDFTRKARLVAGGHMTDPPSSITYASVVSRESVRLAFLIAALNGLEVLAADISGAFLNAPCREKIYIKHCGPEFGIYQGRTAIVERALYGLKSSGAAWRSHCADVIRDMGFQMCKADNDVWLRRSKKPDGEPYYELLLVYTDDLLAISMEPMKILDGINSHFLLKEDSIGPPERYLGASVEEFVFPDKGDKAFAMGSQQYVKEAVRNVETWLKGRQCELKSKARATTVLPVIYRPELDTTAFCNEEDHNFYQQQIGVLRWAVELGRIDICTEVSMLSSYCAAPRVGHLDAVTHLFSYLKHHDRSRIVFDPSYIEHPEVPTPDWSDFYKGYEEPIPSDMPEPLGMPIQTTCFVDSDHAGDTVTRRSRTGVLIFANRAPIIWYSKKQTSIETSSFGSEFSAMKTAVELIEGLRYKLRMMGCPIDGPTCVKGDNMSVINNTSNPESVLKKKSNSIAYHYIRERAASRVIIVSYEHTSTNLADMLTKIQSAPVRQALVKKVLY